MGGQEVSGLLQRGYGEFAADGREVAQELIESMTALQIIDEGLERNPGSDEDRLAAQDVRICMDGNGLQRHIALQWTSPSITPEPVSRSRPEQFPDR